jgi:N-acetylglucosamine-6-phosphate deacetylase
VSGLLLLRNAVLLDPEAERPEAGSLLLEGGRIRARLRASDAAPAAADCVDLDGRQIAPGFIDLHFHGSLIFARPVEYAAALARDSESLISHGTTAFLITSVAWPSEVLADSMTQIASIMTRESFPGALPLGVHLEGPWISAEAIGAQPLEAVRAYDAREGREVLDRAEGLIRMVTLAPEVAGIPELLRELERRSIVPALGHSAADAACAREGVERGIRHATHLFNAMPGIHHREVGATGVALSDDRLSCDLICDGVHVDPALVRVAARAKGQRLMLITDRIDPPADRERADTTLGALSSDETVFRLADGRLAGSRLNLDGAFRNFRDFSGAPLLDAIASCSLRPARLLGVESERGTLRPGARADLAVLDDSMQVRETWLGGRRIWPS